MTTAKETLARAQRAGAAWQREISQFVDDFRRADASVRRAMVAAPIDEPGGLPALVAGVVSALCREADIETPAWAGELGSAEPFFGLPARTFEMRLRLMIESPPPFRVRNVFVPANYLARA